jgi:hypothetical protein
MPMRNRPELGPWAEDNFAVTVRSAISGIGIDAGVPEEIRFLGSIVKLIRLRLAADKDAQDPLRPAIFLLKPSPQTVNEPLKREPALNSGLVRLTGRIWFVSAAANSGRHLEIDIAGDLDALFQLVVEEFKLGSAPALLFDPRAAGRQIRYYTNGLADPEDCQICNLDDNEVSTNSIFELIDRVWMASLMTPRHAAATSIWKNAAKCIPSRTAERSIQEVVRLGLCVRFPACTPRPEYNLDSGRLDILIEEMDVLQPSLVRCRAIIELKVFRSYSHEGNAVARAVVNTSITEGITQVSAYANEKNAPVAALCCFDMRSACTKANCFTPAVATDAASMKVSLAVWFLFSSSKKYRDFRKAESSGFSKHYQVLN